MAISTKNFSTLVSDMVAAVQGQASALVDFGVGGILRAVIEAVAGAVLWLESLILQVAALTRLSTSTGADVDSFVNDYGYHRQGAVKAVTDVTFSRFTPTAQAVIQPGVNVGTLDGTQTFTVTEDTGNAAWSNTLGGYVIPSSTASLAGVPAQAITAGAAGNVVTGAIGLLLTSVSGVDTVTNPGPATGGADSQTDTQVRAGFQQFILSLASGTLAAIGNAIESVQAGLAYNVQENANPDGSPRLGYLTITVDDGTGSPPNSLLASIYTAVNLVRAAGVAYGVFPPTTIVANVAMTITAASGYTPATLVSAVSAAVSTYLAGLTLGTSLPFTKLSQIAYDTSPGVANVTGVSLNSGTADLNITGSQKIIPGTVSVSHT